MCIRDRLLASSIADISDNGEGVVGQFAAEPQTVMFTRNGNIINARMIKVAKVENLRGQESIKKAVEQSTMPGITHSFKVEAFTPDSSAVVLLSLIHIFISKIGVSMLRLSFNMKHIAVISSVKQERGLSYPYARTFNFTLNASF